MNRPEQKLNFIYDEVGNIDGAEYEFSYVYDLEQYCDKLERKCKFVDEVQTPDYERVQKELWETQRALQKLCKKIAETHDCPFHEVDWCPFTEDYECNCNSAKCWEKWSVGNE